MHSLSKRSGLLSSLSATSVSSVEGALARAAGEAGADSLISDMLAGGDRNYLKIRGEGGNGRYIYPQEQTESDNHRITWKYKEKEMEAQN